MVENKTTILISTLITLGLIVGSLVVPSYFDNPKYYCEAKGSILECSGGLSGGLGTRCYINTEKTSYTTCSSGWKEITNDLNITENETEPIIEPIEPVPTNLGVVKYSCNSQRCIRVQ